MGERRLMVKNGNRVPLAGEEIGKMHDTKIFSPNAAKYGPEKLRIGTLSCS